MQLSPFVSLVTRIAMLGLGRERPVLRNYPHCGELGDETKKECLWDCDWQPIPVDIIKDFGPFSHTHFVKNTDCLRDCKSIESCLADAQPVFDNLKQSGETNGTAIHNLLYDPYYICLYQARADDTGNIADTINALVFESCVVTFYTTIPFSGYPCIDEFLIGFLPWVIETNREEVMKRIDALYQTSKIIRPSGFGAGSLTKNLSATLHQYPWLCSLKTK